MRSNKKQKIELIVRWYAVLHCNMLSLFSLKQQQLCTIAFKESMHRKEFVNIWFVMLKCSLMDVFAQDVAAILIIIRVAYTYNV